MKINSFKGLTLAVLLATLAACSTTKVAEAPAVPVAVKAPTAPVAPPAQTTVKQVIAVSPLDDPNSPLAKRSVYFGFDDFQIRSSDVRTIESHAKYLVANKGAKVRLEGNADERGGREYNLALGQKRAEAVRKSLLLLGVSDSSLEAVSFGMEKPVDTAHNEDAWAKNRRVDLRYTAR
ncbi:peptidoglycan-associated lipoprotein Pal [Rhodoferax sp. UBA5149]|uniref:peptidoglycan-associated lipoprotein Pal n=1 Tax=Rhodoferax sp. UBA5149 TaxID=1947379 RepID=UPI0025FE7DB8|nr:peptidoglycan-associated lipoprotein Pal [Rhodoferax sp. UBA5149]